jgi:hypothetical protein
MSEGQKPPGGGGGAPEPRVPKRPIEEIRAELLKDHDVREQARMLQLPVEQYVEKIIDYAMNPHKPPQVQIVPDPVLKAQDPSTPTTAEIKTHLEKLASGEIAISPAHKRDGFEKKDRAREQGRYEEATGTAAKGRKEAPESAPAEPTDTPYKLPGFD